MNDTKCKIDPSIGIIAILPDDFDGPWMGRQQIISRIGKYFYTVLINPPHEWRECWLNTKNRNLDLSTNFIQRDFEQHESTVLTFNSGKWLPIVYKPKILSIAIQYIRIKLALRKLKSLGCNRFVLYLTRPGMLADVCLKEFDLICYHIFDDYSFSETKTVISPAEKHLIQICDIPIFSSTLLMSDKGVYNPNSIVIPNGVDVQLFAKSHRVPEDLLEIPRPIIGYCGIVKKQLDLKLLLKLSEQRKTWSFVFVGPIFNIRDDEEIVEQLKIQSNTYFLGKKNVEELPAYIKQFDVGLLCYKNNNYTKYISPLKLNEYMAAGINIVGTRIPPLIPHESRIYLAELIDEWISAIEKALSDDPNNVAMKNDAKELALEYDWNNIVSKIKDLILSGLR